MTTSRQRRIRVRAERLASWLDVEREPLADALAGDVGMAHLLLSDPALPLLLAWRPKERSLVCDAEVWLDLLRSIRDTSNLLEEGARSRHVQPDDERRAFDASVSRSLGTLGTPHNAEMWAAIAAEMRP